MKLRPRMTNEQIKARLILTVGVGLTAVFVTSIGFMLYGTLFVTQPRYMSEADAEIFSLLSPMMMSLSGGLLGLLAANGLKDKEPPSTGTPPTP
jgi:hypothetical protein